MEGGGCPNRCIVATGKGRRPLLGEAFFEGTQCQISCDESQRIRNCHRSQSCDITDAIDNGENGPSNGLAGRCYVTIPELIQLILIQEMSSEVRLGIEVDC